MLSSAVRLTDLLQWISAVAWTQDVEQCVQQNCAATSSDTSLHMDSIHIEQCVQQSFSSAAY
jgi:hypothetical protein